MKRAIFISGMIILWYWISVILIFTYQTNKGNNAGWKAIDYLLEDNMKAHDSCMSLAQHLWDKGQNTLKWIPKFTRP